MLQPISSITGGLDDDKNKKPAATTKTTAITPNRYTAWGALGEQAQKQGWHPVGWNNETTEYRNNYNNQFNQVVLPGNKRGSISIIGGNKNGVFDVVIKDEKGNIDRTLLSKVNANTVDNYFRSSTGTIAKRAESIKNGTNSDRIMPDGSYTPLK